MQIVKLPENIWRTCVDSMPIFGIDIIIFSKEYGVLMGMRINNPAKGKLFVPGGRVYKNESMLDAFNRILVNETGLNFSFQETTSIGLYEHFYDVTNWSTNQSGTHYIIDARLIEICKGEDNLKLNLKEQHSNFEWIPIDGQSSKDIHHYSRTYLNKIKYLNTQ